MSVFFLPWMAKLFTTMLLKWSLSFSLSSLGWLPQFNKLFLLFVEYQIDIFHVFRLACLQGWSSFIHFYLFWNIDLFHFANIVLFTGLNYLDFLNRLYLFWLLSFFVARFLFLKKHIASIFYDFFSLHCFYFLYSFFKLIEGMLITPFVYCIRTF